MTQHFGVSLVHESGIEYGDREVWASEIQKKADVVVVSPGSENVPEHGCDLGTLYRASRAAKESGIIICVTNQEMEFEPKMDMPLSEILRLHEKRNWDLDEREIQWQIKSLRGKFYTHRSIKEIQKRKVILTPDPNAALQDVLTQTGPDVWLVVLPEARTTVPKITLD